MPSHPAPKPFEAPQRDTLNVMKSLVRTRRVSVALPLAIGAAFALTVTTRVAGQTFPATPASMKDFSDSMLETPNTAMSIDPSDIPLVQPQPDYAGTPAAVQLQSPDTPETGTNYDGPIGVTGVIDNVTTGCSYSPLTHNALRGPITDIDVPGALGKYGLKMRRYYNSRSSQYWDAAVDLSPGWFYEYSWLLWAAGHKIISPQGNVYDDTCGPPVGVSEGWESHPDAYNGTWRLADGGRVHFSGGFADYIDDPYGQRTTIVRDESNRVWKVIEPGGRYLLFTYGTGPAYTDPAYGNQLLKKVEAWDGRGNLIESVSYSYTNVDSGGVDPITGQHIIRKMLTGVAYDDGTAASYTYRTDNVPDRPTIPPYTFKFDPLLERGNDKRYHGPMRDIGYEYQPLGPHGAILAEKCPGIGAVSAIGPGIPVGGSDSQDTFTETRGDGPSRTFNYTHLNHCANNPECDICYDYENNDAWPYRAPQQMLLSYTDFQGHTTQLGYDAHWYVNAVTDANNHTTTYLRGDPPPNGIGEITKITHPDGAYIQYQYEDHGHYITSIRDENGHVTTLHRDGNHRIYQIDYPADANTPASYEGFVYNRFGQVTYHLLRNGAWETYVYDSRGLLTDKYDAKFTVPGGDDPHTHYDYYGPNDVDLSGRAIGNAWIDRVKTVTGPDPNYQFSVQSSESYEYDRTASGAACAGRGLVTKIQHADGTCRSFKYDQWGNKVQEWNELGERTDYVYDGYNRVTSVTNVAQNETTTYTYNPTNGNGGSPYLHTTSNPDTVTAPTGIITSNVYDENFRKTQTSVAGATTWFRYDAVGNQTCVTDPRGTGPCSAGYTTTTDYDSRNRKWHVWDAQGHQTTFTYDAAGNITDIQRPDNTHEIKTYDALNRVITDTVPKTASVSLTTWFVYNPSGTIQKVIDPRGTAGRTYPSGDPAYTTSFAYNAADQRIQMTYPDNSVQSWAYDDAHNMKSRTTVNGETKYFAWDSRNRKCGEGWENFSGEWVIYVLDGVSRLRRVVNGGWQGQTPVTIADVHREYDHASRLILDKQDITGFGVTEVHYQYDKNLRGADGKPTLLYVNNLGDGYDLDYRYDAMGRLEKILQHNATSPWFQYHYDAASNETQRDSLLNHITQIYNPDSLNRPTRVELQHNGATFAVETYDYYPIGRLHTVTRGNRQDQYTYYLDGELQSVTYDAIAAGAPNPGEIPPAQDPAKAKTVEDLLTFPDGMNPNGLQTNAHTVTYALDDAGNRTSVSDSLSGATAYTPNNLNQYTGSVGANPIINGPEHEIANYQGISYTYMKDEHLIRVSSGNTTCELVYDGLGRCIKRTVRTQAQAIQQPNSTPRPRPTPHPRPTPRTTPTPTPTASPTPTPVGQVEVTKYYIYDGDRPILKHDPTLPDAAWINLYGKGVDEVLMRFDPTGPSPQPVFYQQDHEGSVTYLTYDAPPGQTPILEYYRYDVFGQPAIYGPDNQVRQASLYSNRFLFTGREYNANFGFYEYRARAYHPSLGRFMSEDPKLFDAGDYNLFRYCHNDPIDFTDPMGLDYGPFNSPDQAYRFFDAKFNAISIRENKEYRVDIYRMPSGHYYVTDPTTGQGDTAKRPPILVKGAERVAIAHSHGDWSKGFIDQQGKQHIERARNAWEDSHYFKSGEPSPVDRKTAKEITVYTSTPAHEGWKQGPGDKEPQRITPMRDRNDKPAREYPHLTPEDVQKIDRSNYRIPDYPPFHPR